MARLNWPRMIAAILGGLLALWLLSGDRNPDASDGFLGSAMVREQPTADPSMVFYELHFGGPDGGTVLVSGDRDTRLMRYLRTANRERVSVEIAGQ